MPAQSVCWKVSRWEKPAVGTRGCAWISAMPFSLTKALSRTGRHGEKTRAPDGRENGFN
ncbi:hypothetical protein KCP73_11690 [Salmonella enterica subsp. enterica]|nr:hypothetical protein KCP73_11690 [Salmonella enterica subsp. enterica]